MVSNPAQKRQWPDHQNKPRCPSRVYTLRSRQILLCPMPVPALGWERYSWVNLVLSPLHEAWRKAARRYNSPHPRTGTRRGTPVAQVSVLAIGVLVRDASCPPSDHMFHVSTEILSLGREFKWGHVSTKGSCSDKRVSSENPQPALC